MQENNATGNRRLIYVVIASGLVVAALYMNEIVQTKNEIIERLERSVQSLTDQLEISDKAILELRTENDSLRLENQTLRDSVTTLNERIADLQQRLAKTKGELSKTREKLSIAKRDLKSTKEEIERLKKYAGNPEAQAQIAKLRQEVEKLNADISNLTAEKEQLKSQRTDLETKISDGKRDLENLPSPPSPSTPEDIKPVQSFAPSKMNEVRDKNAERLDKITNGTQLRVLSAVCSDSRKGKPIKKLKPGGSNWIVTTLQIELNNPDQEVLREEFFVLKIVDADTGQEMPYLESLKYGDAVETVGLKFQWTENPVKLVYINLQGKSGHNYRVEIHYLDEKTGAVALRNGTHMLIQNDEVVKVDGAY